MPTSPKPKKASNSTSTTRKLSNKRSPKHFTDLEYLRDKKEARKRAASFDETTLTDEEFFKFFEDIGEVWSRSKNRLQNRNRTKTKNKKSQKKRR